MIILMMDTETTSLNISDGGRVHQIGMLAKIVDWTGQTSTVLEKNFLLPTRPEHWHEGTLSWAKRTIPEAVEQTLGHGLTADEVAHKRGQIVYDINSILGDLKTMKSPIKVVFQHPEFDLPFLEDAGIAVRWLFGYRNVLDLSSLVTGFFAGRYPDTNTERMIDAAYKQTKGDHTALADCRAQMARLARIEWAGLHLMRSQKD